MKYYENMMRNEKELYENDASMGKYYTSLKENIKKIEGNDMCEIVKGYSEQFDDQGCKKDLNGLMHHGLRESISIMLLHLFKTHQTYIAEPDTSDKATVNKYMADPTVNNLCIFRIILNSKVDANKRYMEHIFNYVTEVIENESLSFFKSNLEVQKGLFIGYMLSSLLIFFLFTQMLILGLNSDIWRAKRLLALYPIQKISENLDTFKKVVAGLN